MVRLRQVRTEENNIIHVEQACNACNLVGSMAPTFNRPPLHLDWQISISHLFVVNNNLFFNTVVKIMRHSGDAALVNKYATHIENLFRWYSEFFCQRSTMVM